MVISLTTATIGVTAAVQTLDKAIIASLQSNNLDFVLHGDLIV